MSCTRREFGKIALAAMPMARGAARINSRFGGVQIGAITYSFRDINDPDLIIKAMVQIGIGEAELMSNHAEALAGAPAQAPGGGRGRGQGPGAQAAGRRAPRPPMTAEQIADARARNAELRNWRLGVSMDKFKAVRNKFEGAGIDIQLFCFNMTEAITDEEIDYAFNVAKTLGARAISTTTQVSVAKRTAPFADKHKMMIGFHGHDATDDPNEFATPESFATALAYSKYHGINLDIGHFTAGNYDAVAYIKQQHARITNLHLKDRKKDHGANLPWGQGDTPIKEVLLLVKKERYPFPANIEYEYGRPGMDTITEVSKCLQYCKEALA
jgi:sugar phosphate isomerase/epimerase